MNKDKKEPEYPTELESQFILRLPDEPAKALRELLKSGDNLKNRLSIQIDNDVRHGEVKFDNWRMNAKIVDLPTIVESLKTIDNKSLYKTADICQMMICKEEPEETPSEEETPKNKKKDPSKVEKKFLWPHGITPPTKNIRKRRFRKTLKKKYIEAPEIEKEVKRLLRADNEAFHFTWEVIKEEDEQLPKNEPVAAAAPAKAEKKKKAGRKAKKNKPNTAASKINPKSSNVVDIFGGAVSDSDVEDETLNIEMKNTHISPHNIRLSDKKSKKKYKKDTKPIETQTFHSSKPGPSMKKSSNRSRATKKATSTVTRSGGLSEEDGDCLSHDTNKDNMTSRIELLRTELEELKQRRQRTQHEIAGMENQALRQRFQEILHTLNQDVMYKEMEYQGLITLQNSEDI